MDPSDGGIKQLRATPEPQPAPVHSTPTARATTDGPPDGFNDTEEAKDDLKPEMRFCTSTQGPQSPWMENIYRYHQIDDASAKKVLNDPALAGEHSRGKWKNIPSSTKEDDALYEALVKLINKAIQAVKTRGNFDGDRRAIKTAFTQQNHEEAHRPLGPAPPKPTRVYSKPDILIVGQDDRLLPHALSNDLTSEEFRHTIVVGDVKLDSTTNTKGAKTKPRVPGGPNDEETRAQVVMYARQCLIQQGNRHFVFAFVITQTQFRLMIIDRSGALESPWINYHKEPENFIKFAWLVAGWPLEKMGFDTSIYYEGEGVTLGRFINVTWMPPSAESDGDDTTSAQDRLQVLKYRIIGVLYRETGVFGSGTVCWDAVEVGASNPEPVTIKDCWRNSLRKPEAAFLQEAAKNGVEGVTRLLIAAYEPEDQEEKTSTQNARRLAPDAMNSNDGSSFINMVHTRIVTERQTSIVNFKNRGQFLRAFFGAVSAHLDLLEKSEILHRKINLDTVLLGRPSPTLEGHQGQLGDLSMAIKIKRGPNDTMSKSDVRTMAWTFLSRHLLEAYSKENDLETALMTRIHDPVDDLESYAYVFIWITHEFDGPGKRVKKRSENLISLEARNPERSASAKRACLSSGADELDTTAKSSRLTPYFRCPAFVKLFRSICTLIFKLTREKEYGLKPDVTSSDEGRRKTYTELLGYISEAISEFSESEEGKKEAQDSKESGGVSEEAHGSVDSEAPSLERKKSCKGAKKAEVTAPTIGRRRSGRLRDIQSSDAQQEGSGGKRKQAPVDDEDDEISKKVKMEEAEE